MNTETNTDTPTLDTMLADAKPAPVEVPKPAQVMGDLLRSDTPARRWIWFGQDEERGLPFAEGVRQVLAHTERGARREVDGVDLKQARIETNGAAYLATGSERLPLRKHAFGQVCREAAAPAAYLATLPPSIAVDALSFGLKAHAGKGRTIRVEGDEARAVVSARYSALDDRPAMRVLYRGLREAGVLDDCRIDEARAGKRTMLRVSLGMLSSLDGEAGGYGSRVGFTFHNAELGNGSFRVTGSMWDPLCTNGMIFSHTCATWGRRHTGDWQEQVAELAAAIRVIVEEMRTYVGRMANLRDGSVSFDELQATLKSLKGVTKAERTEMTRQTLAEAFGLYARGTGAEAAMARGRNEAAMADADEVMAALRDAKKRDEAASVLAELRISKHAVVSGVTATARDASEDRNVELETAGAAILHSYLN